MGLNPRARLRVVGRAVAQHEQSAVGSLQSALCSLQSAASEPCGQCASTECNSNMTSLITQQLTRTGTRSRKRGSQRRRELSYSSIAIATPQVPRSSRDSIAFYRSKRLFHFLRTLRLLRFCYFRYYYFTFLRFRRARFDSGRPKLFPSNFAMHYFNRREYLSDTLV